jgi:hypothetical protein
MAREPVTLTGHAMTIEQVIAVAQHLEITQTAWSR